MDQQFDLMMFVPGMSYADTESMSTIERTAFYKRLADHMQRRYGK